MVRGSSIKMKNDNKQESVSGLACCQGDLSSCYSTGPPLEKPKMRELLVGF